MGVCSYTCKKLDEKNGEYIQVQCADSNWEGSARYCIFHDPSQEKDIEMFEHELKKKIGRRDFDFQGFSFPDGWKFDTNEFKENANFSYATFQEKACFSYATFEKDADFSDATFEKGADFIEAVFKKGADFSDATFEKDADFSDATFEKDADFSDATFEKVYFCDTTFYEKVYFIGAIIKRDMEFAPNPKEVKQLDLQNAQFLFRGRISIDLKNTIFHESDLENLEFVNCMWPRKIHDEINLENNGLSFKDLESIYRNLKQSMQHHGDYSKAGDLYYREMEYRKKDMGKKKISINWVRSLGYSLLKYTCGYGEKPLRVICNSLVIILLGAIMFFFCGIARVGAEIPPENSPYIIDYSPSSLNFCRTVFIDFGYCFYYSVVTFTTLGYGDIHPLGYSHIFALLEAFTGAFFIALFVVVFARKMMR